MKRRLLILALCCLSLPAWATTYYVDNCVTVGSDSNNGTSTSTPWLTVAHVNAQSFSPGDSVLFQKTCTWRETLTVPTSGSSGSPITFGSYGSGALPVFDGANVFSSWTTYSAAWTPASATTSGGKSTLMWFKADSIGTCSSTAVSSWSDSTGNGHTATQGTGGSQPTCKASQINSLPGIQFSGSQYLTIASAPTLTNTTIFVVMQNDFSSNALMGGAATSGGLEYYFNGSGYQCFEGTFDGSIGCGSTNYETNAWTQIAGTWANATSYAFYKYSGSATVADGSGSSATSISAATATIGADHGGGNTPFSGYIAEIVVYGAVLSSTDITQVQGYLHTRYGI